MDKLLEIIGKEKIDLKYEDFSVFPEDIHGLYMCDSQIGPVIVLGKHLENSRRLHKCMLAHEIGHYFSEPRTSILTVHTSSNLRIMKNQDELKAMRWAFDFLVPWEDLYDAINAGHQTSFELAEYFDVTEWFMGKGLEFYYQLIQYEIQKNYELALKEAQIVDYKYDVALSFAGEDRNYVERVAKYLDSYKVKVFFDQFERSDLLGQFMPPPLKACDR